MVFRLSHRRKLQFGLPVIAFSRELKLIQYYNNEPALRT